MRGPALIALIIASAGGCAPSTTLGALATIGPEGGVVEGPGGARLVIPAGAVNAPVEFRITLAEPGQFSPPVGVATPAVFDLAPKDLELAVAAHLTLPTTPGSCVHPVLGEQADGSWVELDATASSDGFVTTAFNTLTATTAPAPSAPALLGRMFWVEGNDILSARLDGSDPRVVITGTPDQNFPWGLAVEPSNCRIYWTDNGTDSIYSAAFDGTDVQTLFTSTDRFSNPKGIAIDPDVGRIFFGEGHLLRSAGLDGSNPTTVSSGAAGQNYVTGVALDTDSQQVYWTDNVTDGIHRAAYDGSNPVTLLTAANPSSNPQGISMDRVNRRLFWAEGNAVRTASVDGQGLGTVITGEWPTSVVPVPEAGMIFWTDNISDTVSRMTYGGASNTILRRNADPFSNARDLAVYVGDPGALNP